MSTIEGIFLWTAIGFYVISFALGLFFSVFRRKRGIDVWLLRIASVAHLLAILSRWHATGHLPVMGVYENSLTGSWFLSITFVLVELKFFSFRQFHMIVSAIVVLILGNGIQSSPELLPLEPPYRSNWLYVHVLFAWLAFGSYMVAAATGVITVLRDFFSKRFSIPDEKLLDELSLRLILFGFFSETIMIGSGAIWAHGLWGRYWGWDPVETWSLISWLTYGLNIHLRLTYGWREKRAAWLAIISLFGVIALFFGLGYISGLHTRMLG